MKRSLICFLLFSAAISLISPVTGAELQEEGASLLEGRGDFATTLSRQVREEQALDASEDEAFSLVQYPTPLGDMAAYLSRPPETKGKHPAIIWLVGGFPPGGGGSWLWEPAARNNDQTARAFREHGFVVMYPALRGFGGNPGFQESFYGEVNDVLAALDYLAQLDFVDSKRIFLGGHSTGGTLALLVAAATDRFRAVFSFGPAARASEYSKEDLHYDVENEREDRLRSPIEWLSSIQSPTWIVEGIPEGRMDSFYEMQDECDNPKVRFIPVRRANHFNLLHPLTNHFAASFAKKNNPAAAELKQPKIQKAYDLFWHAQQEAEALQLLADLRIQGVAIDKPQVICFTLLDWIVDDLETTSKLAKQAGFQIDPLESKVDRDGDEFFILEIRKTIRLQDLESLFRATKSVATWASDRELFYRGWKVEA